MRRRPSPGIIVAAVVVLLGSLVFLLFAALFLFFFITPSLRFQLAVQGWGLVGMSLFYLLGAGLGIWTGIGLLQLKRLAWISIVIFGVILALFCGCAVLVAMLIPLPTTQASRPEEAEFGRKIAAILFGGLAILGIWWIVFFNRPKIRAQFAGEENTLSQRPMSISIIAVLMMSSPICCLLLLFAPQSPYLFFWFTVEGWMARLLSLVLSGISLWIGIGLWRMRLWSRKAAIYYYIFGFLAVAMPYALPGREARLQELLSRRHVTQQIGDENAQTTIGMTLICGISILLPLPFLFRSRFGSTDDGSDLPRISDAHP